MKQPRMKNEAVRAESILVIDDDSTVLQLQKKVLEEAGYDVILAADGVYGMELFEEKKPDLVILDITMPGPDGFQVLESIRQKSNGSCNHGHWCASSKIRCQKALNLGADDFVAKPFKPGERSWLVVAAKLKRASKYKSP